jgi:hypothetical protein
VAGGVVDGAAIRPPSVAATRRTRPARASFSTTTGAWLPSLHASWQKKGGAWHDASRR